MLRTTGSVAGRYGLRRASSTVASASSSRIAPALCHLEFLGLLEDPKMGPGSESRGQWGEERLLEVDSTWMPQELVTADSLLSQTLPQACLKCGHPKVVYFCEKCLSRCPSLWEDINVVPEAGAMMESGVNGLEWPTLKSGFPRVDLPIRTTVVKHRRARRSIEPSTAKHIDIIAPNSVKNIRYPLSVYGKDQNEAVGDEDPKKTPVTENSVLLVARDEGDCLSTLTREDILKTDQVLIADGGFTACGLMTKSPDLSAARKVSVTGDFARTMYAGTAPFHNDCQLRTVEAVYRFFNHAAAVAPEILSLPPLLPTAVRGGLDDQVIKEMYGLEVAGWNPKTRKELMGAPTPARLLEICADHEASSAPGPVTFKAPGCADSKNSGTGFAGSSMEFSFDSTSNVTSLGRVADSVEYIGPSPPDIYNLRKKGAEMVGVDLSRIVSEKGQGKAKGDVSSGEKESSRGWSSFKYPIPFPFPGVPSHHKYDNLLLFLKHTLRRGRDGTSAPTYDPRTFQRIHKGSIPNFLRLTRDHLLMESKTIPDEDKLFSAPPKVPESGRKDKRGYGGYGGDGGRKGRGNSSYKNKKKNKGGKSKD